jgi:AraC family transcriptional regulator
VSVAVNAICLACEQSDVETTVDGRLLHKGIVPEGSFNVVRPGERSRGVNRGRWERLHIYLPAALLRDLAAEAGAGGDGGSVELVNPVWRIDPSVLRIGREVVRELRTGPALSRLRLDALSQDLAITLLRSHSNLGGSARRLGRDGRGGLAPWQVRRAMAAMDARLDGDIGLAELAALCGVSSAHFGRAFKASTGLSPIAWMLRRKIDLAKALLLDGRLTVAQIALAVGFSAPPQFSTAFRRVTGAAPTEWKRARRS